MPRSRHLQLTANTATPVVLPVSPAAVEVVNVDGAAPIYFTVDGSEPVIAGDDTEVLPAAIGSLVVDMPYTKKTVKLISAGTPRVAVVAQ